MATLATFFKRSGEMAGSAERSFPIRAESDPFRLRALPNDDIYFFSKRIDNGRLVRQADPAARGECWSAVGAAGVILMIGASVIAPHVASVLEGYKLESLRAERQSLLNQKKELEVREAGLLSPERLNDLAKARNLTSPASDQIIHLDNPSMDGTFAFNQPPGRNETTPASGLARAQ
ncbi:MAG: hypothetical protein ABJC09_02555 [Terriglobia bacterium]